MTVNFRENEVTNREFVEYLIATGPDPRIVELSNPERLEYPVAVNYYEADAFAKWLTVREHASGKLPKNMRYSLPTDLQWSMAAGLPVEEDDSVSPKLRGERRTENVYLWGDSSTPPSGLNVFRVTDGGDQTANPGFTGSDAFAGTRPVTNSPDKNVFGLRDLGGNLGEWTETAYESSPFDPNATRVVRGPNYRSGTNQLSKCRIGYREPVTPSFTEGGASLKGLVGFRLAANINSKETTAIK